jgi:hypothetical protein
VRVSSARIYRRLRALRFVDASTASRRRPISSCINTILCAISCAPLLSCLIFSLSELAEEPARFCILCRLRVLCASISRALRGVCASQATLSCCGGVGVRSLTSSFDKTASGLYGASPAPQKPARIVAGVNVYSKATLKAGKKISLLTWLMRLRAKAEIASPYLSFNGEKQATSSGWSRWDECACIQRVIIFFSSQRFRKATEQWLSWPSMTSN